MHNGNGTFRPRIEVLTQTLNLKASLIDLSDTLLFQDIPHHSTRDAFTVYEPDVLTQYKSQKAWEVDFVDNVCSVESPSTPHVGASEPQYHTCNEVGVRCARELLSSTRTAQEGPV